MQVIFHPNIIVFTKASACEINRALPIVVCQYIKHHEPVFVQCLTFDLNVDKRNNRVVIFRVDDLIADDVLFVDWDADSLSIEIQYLDGEVAELDLDAWREMMPQRAEAPEDWRSAFELDDQDLVDPDLPFHPEEWNSPINSIESDVMYGVEDY